MIKLVRNAISSLLLFIGVLCVLGVVCITYPELTPGETSGQVYYIGWGCIIFFILSLLVFTLSVPGEKLFPDFPLTVAWVLIILGGLQSFWGLKQIYGLTHSNHSLFALTGSFFNPGPYSGYLAMIMPICLHTWLTTRMKNNKTYIDTLKYYSSLTVMLLIICVLPAGMSRSSWIAAFISCLVVLGWHYSFLEYFKLAWNKHKKRILVFSGFGVIGMILIIAFIFSIKKDSASGRLFMWKISSHAIMQKPLTGHGTNSFAMAYGDAQEAYFAFGNYTKREELVAGSPEYAFNEYLQIALELGIPVLIMFLMVILFCLYLGFRNKRIGICAAIISLLIFAFSSYPFQLPVFVITFIFLLAACVMGKSKYDLAVFAIVVGGIGFYLQQNNLYDECREWSKSRILYQVGVNESVVKEYKELYPKLKNRSAFLFEYGHAYHKLGKYELSNNIMFEAAHHSCDPMIFNIIGKNYQSLGDYEQAENWLLRSINRLPGRIYPYYLLAKLYAEPEYFQPEKLKEMVEVVLVKEPKVQSTAIKQMRQEVQELAELLHSP